MILKIKLEKYDYLDYVDDVRIERFSTKKRVNVSTTILELHGNETFQLSESELLILAFVGFICMIQ